MAAVSSPVRVLAVALLAVLTGVWLQAQPKPVASTLGATGANPAYIVVNTPTAVLFTARITDPQLKKHSVILVRLDAAGNFADILGRLKDDGRNGDLKANDNTYSLHVRLTEPQVGPVSFKVAARFKPGKWRDFEPDDDDWDRDLAPTNQPKRDHPAQREWLRKLFSRFVRYTLSAPIVVTVDPFLLPPDPGEAGKQTLQGVDSDADGLRDDIQRWIAISFRDDLRTRRALIQKTLADQASVMASNVEEDSIIAGRNRLDALQCLMAVRPEDYDSVDTQLRGVVANTRARVAALLKSNNWLSGRTYRLLPPGKRSELCDFE
jgi:hypothetical protein